MNVQEYLREHDVPFEAKHHRTTFTARDTAQAMHVPGDHVAKAVLMQADGHYVLIEKHQLMPQNRWEVWALPTVAGTTPFLLMKSAADARSPAVSPDGKWLAFAGRDSGRYEVYVIPFHPDPGDANPRGKWQISSGGAFAPVWSKNGKELFYNNSSYTTLIAAAITGQGESFEASAPKPLFDLNPHPVFNNFYVPTPDGQHFYLTVYSQGSTAPFTITVNWTEKLAR